MEKMEFSSAISKKSSDGEMPEGPEVHALRDWFEENTKDVILSHPTIIAGRYSRTQPKGWDLVVEAGALTVDKVGCKGKFLWMQFRSYRTESESSLGIQFREAKPSSIFLEHTLGLTGRWDLVLVNAETTLPSQARLSFLVTPGTQSKFSDETQQPDSRVFLIYSDQRNFGTLSFSKSPADIQAKLDNLAPDLLVLSMIPNYDLDELITGWIAEKPRYRLKKNIVKTLMSQNAADTFGSGIGNYLAAEILYRAKLSPHRELGTLTLEEIHQLTEAIRWCFIYFAQFDTFLEDYQADKLSSFCVYRKKVDPSGRIVETCEVVSGRTMWWIPGVQV